MLLKHILFDLGGVLVRTESQEPRTQLEAELGLAPGQASEIVFGGKSGRAVQLGLITDEAHWRHIQERLGMSPAELARFRTEFFASDRVDMQLVEYIDRLRSVFTIGLLSNAATTLRQLLDEPYRLAPHFDHITISAEEGVMKPDPRIFRIALERAAAAFEETVFVDDFIENVEGARQLGMAAIHFVDPRTAYLQLAELTGIH